MAVSWIVVDFLLGLLVIWNYAAVRPRFGPGPKTAMLAALPLFGAVTLVLFGFASMGWMTYPTLLKGTVLSLVNMLVGSVVGAWAYREA